MAYGTWKEVKEEEKVRKEESERKRARGLLAVSGPKWNAL